MSHHSSRGAVHLASERGAFATMPELPWTATRRPEDRLSPYEFDMTAEPRCVVMKCSRRVPSWICGEERVYGQDRPVPSLRLL